MSTKVVYPTTDADAIAIVEGGDGVTTAESAERQTHKCTDSLRWHETEQFRLVVTRSGEV